MNNLTIYILTETLIIVSLSPWPLPLQRGTICGSAESLPWEPRLTPCDPIPRYTTYLIRNVVKDTQSTHLMMSGTK